MVGDEMLLLRHGEDRQHHGNPDRGRCQPNAGMQQRAEQRGAGKTADAEEGVEAGHDRPGCGVLHRECLGVHRDVHRAERRAEDEQRGGDEADVQRQRQQGQGRTRGETGE